MAAETENRILEPLRAIRTDLAPLGQDFGIRKERPARKAQLAPVRADMAGLQGDHAILRDRREAAEGRLARIGRRLERTSA